MKKLKARIGSVIDFPAEALRSLVVDAGLSRALRMRVERSGACGNEVSQEWLLENEVPLSTDEQT
ncbi:hypothetical protein SAMN04487965_0851 [Microbulbifer donghaiensis]|uniref:Uncharacterized protein n=1 Tax=Microbulbifer donghaiensis TaxID=494016 RepID=A0A1M4X381_9GAMM|nr:hypothetical protein [Microbulbifer donghaiensis]SHE87968.1 hypothetical protein SAMN04487965_0851 [Microbulbifer donghaiensis]